MFYAVQSNDFQLMSHHRYLRNHYFDPNLEIVSILTECQNEALKKVEPTELLKHEQTGFLSIFSKTEPSDDFSLPLSSQSPILTNSNSLCHFSFAD